MDQMGVVWQQNTAGEVEQLICPIRVGFLLLHHHLFHLHGQIGGMKGPKGKGVRRERK
jgi:hypothetical protein